MADEIRLVKDLLDVQRRHNRGEPLGLHANNIITRAIEVTEDNAKLRRALAFAASVIKSGEPWTPTCDAEIGALLQNDKG